MNFYKGEGLRQKKDAAGKYKEVEVKNLRLTTDKVKISRSYAGYVLVGRDGANEKDEESGRRVVRAVNTALVLGRPLLVSGEPGSGKTTLGHSISWELMKGIDPSLQDDPSESGAILFVTKSTSKASELFYEYDALSDFRNKDGSDRREYIRYTGLGLAILLAMDKKTRSGYFPTNWLEDNDKFQTIDIGGSPVETLYGKNVAQRLRSDMASQSVVIIDEVDKAPRDFPNDLLHEINEMTFYVPEIKRTAPRPPDALRPIVVITSNSERQLPDAFLRRCAFIHIESPNGDTLKAILESRLGFMYGTLIRDIQDWYERDLSIKAGKLTKPVATSELLEFCQALYESGLDEHKDLTMQKDRIGDHLSLLGKTREDSQKIKTLLDRYEGRVNA